MQFVEWGGTDIDAVPRPMVAAGLNVNSSGWELPQHSHRKSELIYTIKGILTCEADGNLWTVPPQSAIWLPGSIPHKSQAFGELEFNVLLIEPDACSDLPKRCCMITVSPLLRELLLRVSLTPMLYDMEGPAARMLPVILDELRAAPYESARLPLPRDPNLRRLIDMIMAAPADRSNLSEWAVRSAMSERTLSRRFAQELGMSLGQWRHQLHVTLALQRLAAGDTVQMIAFDLGYESASSFITMFKKILGKSPIRYFQDQEALATKGTSPPP